MHFITTEKTTWYIFLTAHVINNPVEISQLAILMLLNQNKTTNTIQLQGDNTQTQEKICPKPVKCRIHKTVF